MLGALWTALLSTSNLATKKLEIGKLKQMVLLTKLTTDQGDVMKTTVLTDVEVGILAVFLEQTDTDQNRWLASHNSLHYPRHLISHNLYLFESLSRASLL